MRPGLTHDSNSTVLADAVRELGCEPVPLGIIRDEEALLLDTLLLREVAGLSGPEVAAHLGVTEEVVKTRIHRARQSLSA